MSYIVPIHHPSSVRHALKLRLPSLDGESLIVGKSNRLELWTSKEGELTLLHSEALYGKIIVLQKVPAPDGQQDYLFVGVDSKRFILLAWDATSSSWTLANGEVFKDIADRTARSSQTGERCWLDPTGQFLTVEVYEGMIITFPIQQPGKAKQDVGLLAEPSVCRIQEFFVRSSAFIHGRSVSERPRLAILYEDYEKAVRLRVRELQSEATDASRTNFEVDYVDLKGDTSHNMDLGSNILIPISSHPYGLLILGETSISYYNEKIEKPYSQPLQEATVFVAWEQIDDRRFLLADDYGKLYLLMLNLDEENHITDWALDVLGEASHASVLVYLGEGLVYIGSHEGDSQLLRIVEGGLEVQQSFANIAPILDFTIMDMGNREVGAASNEFSSGQARVVTGSGAWKDGSLRSVRSGVRLEVNADLGQMEFVDDLFNLRLTPGAKADDSLLISFATESRIFRFDEDGGAEEEADTGTFDLQNPTLLAMNLTGSQVLQVTPHAARIIDIDGGMVLSNWSADTRTITAVSQAGNNLVLVLNGVLLTVLDLQQSFAVVSEKTFTQEQQLSCVAVSALMPGVVLIGDIQRASLHVLDIKTLQVQADISLDQIDTRGASARSIIVANLYPNRPPSVLIGLSDGSVAVFSSGDGSSPLKFENITRLGTQEVKFRLMPRGGGISSVFALCENPSLIYHQEGRIVFSAVTAEGDALVCPFDAAFYPGGVAIATRDGLSLAVMDTERRADVTSLQVGETVRRIAYSAELRAFGLGTIKRTLSEGVERVQSCFKLADEVVFQEIDAYNLNEDELIETVIRTSIPDNSGESVERFLVGTSYLPDESEENPETSGRILVFEVTSDRKIKLVTQHSLKGACRCLATIGDKIVAALIKTVVVFTLEFKSAIPSFKKLATYRTSTAPIDMTVTGNLIAVADLTKSVSVVEYKPAATNDGKDELVEIARHYQTTWGTAVANIDNNKWLEADAEGNLLVLVRDESGAEEDDRRRLRMQGEICLSEMVNRIRKIDVGKSPGAVVIPNAFIATVEGSLFLFATLTDEWRDDLLKLQTELAEPANGVPALGGLSFDEFRAYKSMVRTEQRPELFVDGEMVEKFLKLPADIQAKCAQATNRSVEEIVTAVETLRRLR